MSLLTYDYKIKDLTFYSKNRKELYNNLGISYNNINNFSQNIIKRGIKYYKDNKVLDIEKENNIYYAIITGNKDYNVLLEIVDGDIRMCSCTCPYSETNTYCKHIYALYYSIKDKEPLKEDNHNLNIKILKKTSLQIIKKINKESKRVNDYIKRHKRLFTKSNIKESKEYRKYFKNEYKSHIKQYNEYNTEDDYYYFIHRIIGTYNYMKSIYNKILDNKRIIIYTNITSPTRNNTYTYNKQTNTTKYLYDYNNNIIKDSKGNPLTNHSIYTEEEINEYNLNDEEKALVYSGDYSPWSFEDDKTFYDEDYEDDDI